MTNSHGISDAVPTPHPTTSPNLAADTEDQSMMTVNSATPPTFPSTDTMQDPKPAENSTVPEDVSNIEPATQQSKFPSGSSSYPFGVPQHSMEREIPPAYPLILAPTKVYRKLPRAVSGEYV
jgi:hypothetical protein